MDQVEEIKKRIDVVSLISSYLSVKKSGKNYKACCPFHKEKTASFMVSPEKQIWYCFGCNQGGDIFNFIEKIEGLDFVGALHLLADRAGVILEKGDYTKKSEKDRYLQILDLASRYFHFILNEHNGGREAKKYLVENRKIKEETIKTFMIGYAPNNPTLLKEYLLKKGFKQEELEKLGIVTKNYQGKWVDKFRDRIIFPIRNINGRVAGFGGRIFHDVKGLSLPKYINSTQSDVYDKSSILYGLEQAKESIRDKDLVIIVEGYLDVISSHQAGVKNVVASSGTALTQRQIDILSRYTNNIAFCFDSDEAGQIATKRAMEITQFSDINVKAIKIEGAKDPDELILRDPKLWMDATEKPINVVVFYYDNLLKRHSLGKNPDDKKLIAKDFIPILVNIYNDIEKAHWIKRVSNDLGVNEKYFMDALDKFKVQSSKFKVGSPTPMEEGKTEKIRVSKEMLLLSAIVLFPSKMEEFFKKIKIEDISDDLGKNLYKLLYDWHNSDSKDSKESKKISLEYVKERTEQEKHRDLDLLFFLTLSFFEDLSDQDILNDIDVLIADVLKETREKRKKQIEAEIALLDKSREKAKITCLLKELQSLI